MSVSERNQSDTAVVERTEAEPTEVRPRASAGPGSDLSTAPKVARNASYNFLSHVWLTGLAIFCTPYIVHRLGDGAYGLLSMVMVVTGYFAMLDLGLAQAVLKYASEYYGRQDYGRLSRLIGTATTIYVGVGLVGAAVIALLTGVIVMRVLNIETELRSVAYFAFYAAALGFLVSMPLSVFNAIPASLQRMDVTNARNALIGTGTVLGSVILLKMGFWLREILLLNIALNALGVIAFVAVSRRLLPAVSFVPRFDRQEARRLFRFGLPTAASSAGARLMLQFDRVILGMFWPMAYVTYYVIPMEMCSKGMVLVRHVTGALFPAVSDRSGNGDMDAVRRMYFRATRVLASGVIPIFVFLGVFSHPVLTAWMGERIANQSAVVLSIAAAAFAFQFAAALQNTFLLAMGHASLMAKWNIIPGLANLALNLVLIPRYGVVGAAAAMLLVSLGSAIPYTYVVSRRVLEVSPATLVGYYAAPAVLSAICVLPAIFVRGSLTSLPLVAAAFAATGLLYLVIGTSIGVVPKDDLVLAWTVLRGRRKPASPTT